MIHEAGTHDIGLRLRCGRIGSQTNAKTQVIFLVLKSVNLALNQASISVKPETNQSTYAWLLGTLGDDSENVTHLKSELNLHRVYYNWLTLSIVGELSWG